MKLAIPGTESFRAVESHVQSVPYASSLYLTTCHGTGVISANRTTAKQRCQSFWETICASWSSWCGQFLCRQPPNALLFLPIENVFAKRVPVFNKIFSCAASYTTNEQCYKLLYNKSHSVRAQRIRPTETKSSIEPNTAKHRIGNTLEFFKAGNLLYNV